MFSAAFDDGSSRHWALDELNETWSNNTTVEKTLQLPRNVSPEAITGLSLHFAPESDLWGSDTWELSGLWVQGKYLPGDGTRPQLSPSATGKESGTARAPPSVIRTLSSGTSQNGQVVLTIPV
ncbi:MAG: hypothetical protein GWO24_34360 [Akkermansiaceae bacterium]|nr:hypothetical protein [Akkermansiaceae bacterium]